MNQIDRGRQGGLATLARHGQHHFSIIGRAGYEVTLERHFAGDARAMHEYLTRCRHAVSKHSPSLRCRVRRALSLIGPS